MLTERKRLDTLESNILLRQQLQATQLLLELSVHENQRLHAKLIDAGVYFSPLPGQMIADLAAKHRESRA